MQAASPNDGSSGHEDSKERDVVKRVGIVTWIFSTVKLKGAIAVCAPGTLYELSEVLVFVRCKPCSELVTLVVCLRITFVRTRDYTSPCLCGKRTS